MKEFVDAVKRLVDLMPTGAALPHFYARDEVVKVRELLGEMEKPLSEVSLDEKLQLSERHRKVVSQRTLLLNTCQSVILNMDKADQREKLWDQVGNAITQVGGGHSGGFMYYRPNPFRSGVISHRGELPGMWDESDLIGGEADCAEDLKSDRLTPCVCHSPQQCCGPRIGVLCEAERLGIKP